MSAQYSVIRYVPDPIAEECVNFGVVTWDRDRIRCRFLSNWTRIRLFGNENVGFLKDFAKEMLEVTSRQMSLAGINAAPVLTVDELNKIVANWGENIQFSSPRGSIKDADALISDIAPLYLRQRRHAGARARTRAVAAKTAANIMLEAVRRRVPDDAERLVKRREIIDGAIEQHKLDVALANGHLIAGVQAISFEINVGEHLEKEVLSVKWALSDIRQRHAGVPIAVFAFPPTGGGARTAYRDARHAFTALQADIMTSSQQMEQWANERALAIPVHRN